MMALDRGTAYNPFQQLELDTDSLNHAIVLVAKLAGAGRFQGSVSTSSGVIGQFSLTTALSPGAPSVNIDLAGSFANNPTFTVVDGGYVLVHVGPDGTGYSVEITSDQGPFLSNKSLRKNQSVILRLIRPGIHEIKDVATGAVCELTVEYPKIGTKLATDPIKLTLANGQFDPRAVTGSAVQPLVIDVDDRSHIVSALKATTDRMDGKLVTTRTSNG